jgi:two-component system, chemotaxis family, chemotaxis protein CheY
MQNNNLHNLKILIADDEPLIQKLVHDVLVSLGFTNTTIVNSGHKAINLIEKGGFDFIITDWRMDDLDGIDIVNYVRGSHLPPLCNMPIIMLTGNTEASYVKTAINAGVNGYVIKPFSAEQLVGRIRAVIERPRDFVISKNYTGPDRRHINLQPPNDVERRKASKKQSPELRANRWKN